jgi:hypothetical protein
MKPGFHLWMLKPKSSQSSGCTHIHQTSRKSLNKYCLPESWWQLFSATGKECWWWNSCNMGPQQQQKRTVKHLKETPRAIQTKMHGMLTSSIVLLHDNARPHIAACTWNTAGALQLGAVWPPSLQPWSRFQQLPPVYLPKEWLWLQYFNNNELMESVKTWLSSQAANFFDTSIHKLIPWYDKYLSSSSYYVEK